MDFPDQRKRCHQYVDALEEERRKIQVFRRELPLCLELVTQAIEACRRELPGSTEECSERSSSGGGPVLEEFIPINPHRTHSSDDNDEKDEENENENKKEKENENHRNTSCHDDDDEDDRRRGEDEEKEMEDSNKNSTSSSNRKSDWLRSAQLWNQSPDPPPVNESVPRKAVVKEVKRNQSAGAFQPFQKETSNVSAAAAAAAAAPPSSVQSSTAVMADTSVSNTNTNKQQQKDADNKEAQQRKQRRCWSPELHRRFLHALQQLGGSQAATPKQIRELMKVDGLTNDEVKSHLQKYRLHTRRPSHGGQNASTPAGPQFVVVGGIWVPPSAEYAAAGGSGSIYAPVARTTAEAQRQQASSLQSEGRGSSRSEGGVHHPYSSPSTCSSTHTATSSPEV